MRLRFVGQDKSMGRRFGRVYRLKVEPWKDGVRASGPGFMCPYETEDAFWRNWENPNTDLREKMEKRGSDLRAKYLPEETK